jgi:hypothetical protein
VTERPLTVEIANSIDVNVGEKVGVMFDAQSIRILPGEER